MLLEFGSSVGAGERVLLLCAPGTDGLDAFRTAHGTVTVIEATAGPSGDVVHSLGALEAEAFGTVLVAGAFAADTAVLPILVKLLEPNGLIVVREPVDGGRAESDMSMALLFAGLVPEAAEDRQDAKAKQAAREKAKQEPAVRQAAEARQAAQEKH